MKCFMLVLLALVEISVHAADHSRFVLIPLEQVGGKPLSGYGPNNDWSSVPQGEQTFGGVPFDIVAKLQLHGNTDARDNRFYPARVIGIDVQQRLARLHLLHGGNISETNDKPIAAFRLRYAGGKTHTIFVTYGVHVRNWWKNRQETTDSVTDTNSSVVWTGPSVSNTNGATHRLYKTSFDLPVNDQPVERIDAFSLFSKTSLIILGLTGELPIAGVARGQAGPSEDDTKLRDELLLKVIDIAGNPVGGVRVRGVALDERGTSTTLGRLDDSFEELGSVTVDFPAGTRELRLTTSAQGNVPNELRLKASGDGRFAREVTAKMEPGVRIGGFVRDTDGNPLPRAKVEMFRATRDERGSVSLFKYEENTADSQGRWRLREAPESLEDLRFRVTLANYRQGDYEFSGETGTGSLSRNALLTSQAEFKLAPTLRIAGTVQDTQGRLLRGIEVSVVRTNEYGGTSSTQRRTDTKGAFQFISVDSEAQHLLVQNSNFAPTVINIDPARDTGPIKVVLVSGSPLRGRFIETTEAAPNGRPISGADVQITSTNSRLITWRGKTDAEGRFVWEHAPEGLMRVNGYGPNTGSRNFTARAGAGEVTFDLSREFVWRMRAVDAASKAPIAAFSVTPGHQYAGNERANWMTYYTGRSTNGEVVFSDRNNPNSLKVEAPGYTPLMVPVPERDSSATNHVFSLQRAINIKGVAKLPDGKPAAGAEIAAVSEGYLSLGRGAFVNHRNAEYTNLIVKADAEGRFEIPPRLTQRLVVVHEGGFAETTQSNLATQAEVTLQPFGIIEGVMMIGSKLATNAALHLNESRGGGGLNFDYSAFGGQTDSEGKFRYTHVPPGKRFLSRMIETRPNTRSWSHTTPVNVESGRTTQVQFGGTGRPVIGTIVPDDPARAIDWKGGYHHIYSRQAPVRFASAAESRAYNSPEAVRARQDEYRNYAVTFSTNGTFRVEDIPPGLYTLQCQFHAPRPDTNPNRYGGDGPLLGNLTHQFEVPAMGSERSEEPFDLGKVEFKVRR